MVKRTQIRPPNGTKKGEVEVNTDDAAVEDEEEDEEVEVEALVGRTVAPLSVLT